MENNFGNRFRNYLKLSKLKVMIPVSFTGFTGYFIFDPHISLRIIMVTLGILLLAISASVLNQLQEVDIDRKMERTHDRPLPSGKIKAPNALAFFFFNLLCGIIILYKAGNILTVTIGLLTIVWYNGVYTYSKRITAFAVVPGAVTGALPPLMGWVAAGGGVWDKPIIFLEFLFFAGQIPHFWILILKYGEEYQKAGIPSLTMIMSRQQINRLTFTWVVTSVLAALFLCYFEIIRTELISGILLIASAYLIWQFSRLLRLSGEMRNYNRYSMLLYSYFFLMMVLLISDRILT
jgi:protoheme IX farnesyltransferase